MENKVLLMTPAMLEAFADRVIAGYEEKVVARLKEAETQKDKDPYAYGLQGIRDLFGCSHSKAQEYKNTFLAPAVTQHGRKIIVNKAKARELFKDSVPGATGRRKGDNKRK